MFDIVQKNKTLVQIVLGLVALGLVIGAGVSGYSAMSGADHALVKVDGKSITEYDVQQATNGQPISNEMRPMVIEQLVQQRLVLAAADKLGLNPSKPQLQQAISQIDAFHENGKFSPTRYQEMLAAQQMSPAMFEQRVRDSIAARTLLGAYSVTNIVPQTTLARMAKLVGERREVQATVLAPSAFVGQVSVSADEIKKYYDSHASEFKAPEMVRVEYVMLSRQQIAAKLAVSDEEIQKYFDAHRAELLGEQRDVAHILFEVPKGAKPDVKAKVRAEAEKVLAELKANPGRFAELAKQYSKDPGSAANGGELGVFGADASLVAPFKEAMFKLPKGQLSDLVESEFGFHIIRVNDIQAKSTFEQVKPQVVAKLQGDKAESQYRTQAQAFGELVYQKGDSLKPAADEFKLPIQQSGWITRQGAQDPQLNNPKLAEAVFSDDVLKGKHNSEAIEVAPDTLVSARILEHKAAQQTPLDTVRGDIEQRLKLEKAAKLAAEAGAKQLAALQAGQDAQLTWQPSRQVGRLGERELNSATLAAVFSAPADKLPAYVGQEVPGAGYVIFKVVSAIPAPPLSDEMAQRMRDEVARTYGQVEVSKYISDLKAAFKVEYRKAPADAGNPVE
ncbi:peptidylprolyl isomerase [Chitiniphilus shinanonensis]|uniref:Periplasmic chaperone PpiD n=1 Tax=Chitiniphilus shinanonensis TaxID=553088 RepID=A0ABQ6BR00_9NEIS|nr:SurA N-terminal domain-containing protein [Chitiniphilus shinanonensis]GLS04251.1 peptidylprolyl isomerase [Chitiniphilus shinanonensis]